MDGVSTAFQMILEEIDSVVSEVNSQGAAFLRNGEYQKAKDAIESGEKLAEFRGKLESLKEEWINRLDESTRNQVTIEPVAVAKTIASAPKSSRTVLVVKFADGAVIYETKAVDTFVKSIKKLGADRVLALGIEVNGFPLVSKQQSDGYPRQTQLDSYYVITHSSTEAKRDQLLRIASALQESISVDIVPAQKI